MPTGIYKRTKEYKENMSKVMKGHCGVQWTKEQKENLSKKAKEQFKNGMPEETKEKIRKKLKGRKRPPFSAEWKAKIRKNGTRSFLGKRHTEESKIKMSNAQKGEKGSNWKGGISSENEKNRKGIEFRLWREKVFKRDSYTCQKCSLKSGGGKAVFLHPHHIENFAVYLEKRFNVDNGITFCEKCHKLFHKSYGFKNNNKKQIKEFLNFKLRIWNY